MQPNIHIVDKHTVNKEKWNSCLATSGLATLYASIDYLNIMVDDWIGVTNENYTFVIAFPIKSTFGIRYTYTPPFVQQQNIHGTITEKEKEAVWKILTQIIKYGSFASAEPLASGKILEQKTNFLLPLHQPYTNLAAAFSNDLKRNIDRASKRTLQYDTAEVDTAIKLYQQFNGYKTKHVTANDYHRLHQFCKNNKEKIITQKVVNDSGEIVAIALCIQFQHRIYNLLNTTTQEGKKISANHLLLSKIIEAFAERDLYFDFEGSSIPGIKQFYQGFNPIEETYTISRFNLLPFPLSLIP